jgi:hypothetical protein
MYSFVNWRKEKLPEPGEVIPLGEECSQFQVTPSEQIYYYTYPYKVTLKNHIDCTQSHYDIRRDVVMRKLMLEEFHDNELKSGMRSHISMNAQRVYLRGHNDLKTMLHFFYTEIENISGPISSDHAEILLSDDYFCTFRKPFYDKFDIRLHITIQSNRLDTFMYSGRISAEDRREIINGSIEFFKQSIPAHKQRWIYDNLYTTSEELHSVLPFLKLQWPDARLIITKCVSK